MDGVGFCPFTDFFCSTFHPISQECPQPFSSHHLFREGDHLLMISPGKLTSPGILPGKNPVFVAFNGKGNSCPYRNGVKTPTITDIVNLNNGLKVIIKTQRSQCSKGFIFRFVCFACVGSLLYCDFSTAGNRTTEAGI